MKTAKGILSCLIFLSFFSIEARASHQAGANITYKWISGNEYEIHVVFYRDCSGVTPPFSAVVCYSTVSNGFADTILIPMTGFPTEVPPCPVLPPITSTCNGGSGFGIEKCEYTANLTLPFTADDWVLSYTTPLVGSFGTQGFTFGYYVSTKIDNINYQQNSSVEFTTDPCFQYCLNQYTYEFYTSIDDDGDSLVYSIDTVRIDSVFCMPDVFTNPDPTSTVQFDPLASSVPYYIQPNDGWITFIPSQIQTGCISIKAAEYRNGVLINETTRYNVMYCLGGCIGTGYSDSENTSVKISPTLITEKLNVTIDDMLQEYQVTVLDMCGKTVYTHHLKDNQSDYELDLHFLNSGSYFILFQNRKTIEALSRFRFVKL